MVAKAVVGEAGATRHKAATVEKEVPAVVEAVAEGHPIGGNGEDRRPRSPAVAEAGMRPRRQRSLMEGLGVVVAGAVGRRKVRDTGAMAVTAAEEAPGGQGASQKTGGMGGFGGGGGAAGVDGSQPGQGGFGGGSGSTGYNFGSNSGSGGGGGGAFGGAIFVRADNGATLNLVNSSIDQGNVTAGQGGSGAGSGQAAGSALFLTGGRQDITVSGGSTQTIAGSIAESAPSSLNKLGMGSLILSANNGGPMGYSGGTTVSQGTLMVDNTSGSGTGSGSVEVLKGASIGGNGSIAGNLMIDRGGHLIAGTSPLSLGGDLTMASKSILNETLGGTSTPIDVAGVLTLDGRLNIVGGTGFGPGIYTLFDYGTLVEEDLKVGRAPSGFTYSISVDTVNHQVDLNVSGPNTVPEPSSWLILGLGITATIATRRWRR